MSHGAGGGSRATSVRKEIVDELRREIVGPDPGLVAIQLGIGEGFTEGEEILRSEDPPRIRYGAGVLFPRQAKVASQEDGDSPDPDLSEERELDEEDQSISTGPAKSLRGINDRDPDTEQEISRANEFLPGAMGVTAFVDVPTKLKVEVTAARYEPMILDGQGWVDKTGNQRPYKAWKRIPIEDCVELIGADLLEEDRFLDKVPIKTGNGKESLFLHILCRKIPEESSNTTHRMITFSLINETNSLADYPSDEDCFFQCELLVTTFEGTPCFLSHLNPPRTGGGETDNDSLRLLYRKRKVFAVGHGCAADWGPVGQERVAEIYTETIPAFEIPPILPAKLKGINLSMWELGAGGRDAILGAGETLCEFYEGWISDLQEDLGSSADIVGSMKDAAERNLANCVDCLDRMRGGLEILWDNETAAEAFALANTAMAMQRSHYSLASENIRRWKPGKTGTVLEAKYVEPDYSSDGSKWYPFQFAFVLMSLRSLVDTSSSERELVDVIWFPTGGGKTEAYLGLAAFAIIYRRLTNPKNDGTSVLMRYTLRLLTTQQYQRSASLICALEVLRKDRHDGRLGASPITIGLWVGSGVTPNNEKKAVAELRRMQREGGRDNPFVLLACPWCGAEMGAIKVRGSFRCKGYRQTSNPQSVRHVCEDPDCRFNEAPGLPVFVTDQAIYSDPPSLVIGTVDKFALLPWYSEARALFGIGRENSTPPDLIIQDELHLISGPLGSMVGLYETVISELCKGEDGTPVKIVGSTATIARASEQIVGLYAREQTFLFPPQGLNWGESFFAEERPDLPGRLYVGVFASALPSEQTALVRTLSTLLQSPSTALAKGVSAKNIDPYWTLIAYFNSLRELGTAATLVNADIRRYLGVIHERKALSPRWGKSTAQARRFLHNSLELTSRITRGEISEALALLFRQFDGNLGSAHDICLATNMIQVGLDVPRLGLMVVEGQPKTAAEYIQATSRVGRGVPGLVVSLFNPSKPRDRSHYEHFRAFHESIYQWVEPSSVTPFALPVRDRALHALVITLVRYWGSEEIGDRPTPPPSGELFDRIRDVILSRVDFIDAPEGQSTEAMLDRLIEEWQRLPARNYGHFGPPDPEVPLMYQGGTHPLPDWDGRAIPTPTSMRNVDATCEAAVVARYDTAGIVED